MPVPVCHTPGDPMKLSPIVFGGGALGSSYTPVDEIWKSAPDAIVSAFRHGINSIDTSPFYSISEEVIGSVLSRPAVREEFPRESYYLITKTGRFGTKRKDFDYSRQAVLESVKRSCERLHTSYLDAVYVHDVEFVAENIGNVSTRIGEPTEVLRDPYLLKQAGLAPSSPQAPLGKGDHSVIEAVNTLFELKSRGIVRRVGISGYPLPTLLRISRLVNNYIGTPLDVVFSYCHRNLQNNTLHEFIPHFREAGVGQIVNGSPLGMGLLRSTASGPSWHPAPAALKETIKKIGELCDENSTTLEKVALSYGLEDPNKSDNDPVPATAVGMATDGEVKEAMAMLLKDDDEKMQQLKKDILGILKASGFHNWSWASPPEGA